MLEHPVQMAAKLIAEQANVMPVPGQPGTWMMLVLAVLVGDRFRPLSPAAREILEAGVSDPAETAGQGAGRLAEILEQAGLPTARARPLTGLANWWLRRFSEEGEEALGVLASRSLESWQSELREIPGVSWELADRVLLWVGGLPVYPLDRGSMRIALRHGWVDTASEYEEWQAFFAGPARDGAVRLPELARGLSRVAREFCKTEPCCSACPLQGLLPARGPIPLDGD